MKSGKKIEVLRKLKSGGGFISFNIRILKMGLKEMKLNSLLKGGIYEVSFGYHSNLGGYTTLMSYIPELGVIAKMR